MRKIPKLGTLAQPTKEMLKFDPRRDVSLDLIFHENAEIVYTYLVYVRNAEIEYTCTVYEGNQKIVFLKRYLA